MWEVASNSLLVFGPLCLIALRDGVMLHRDFSQRVLRQSLPGSHKVCPYPLYTHVGEGQCELQPKFRHEGSHFVSVWLDFEIFLDRGAVNRVGWFCPKVDLH